MGKEDATNNEKMEKVQFGRFGLSEENALVQRGSLSENLINHIRSWCRDLNPATYKR